MDIVKYPDGSSYASVSPLREFIFKVNSYEDLWHLNQIIDAQNSLGITPIVTIPNLIDAQADRRFSKNESSGLKLVCNFLNNMNASFRIFHPHNLEVVEALMDNVEIVDNSEFINKVFAKLAREVISGGRYFNEPSLNTSTLKENLILISSDAGGFKPLMKLCDKICWQGETASASKSRIWDGKESRLVQQIQCEDFEGKDILIIDDICVYGALLKAYLSY
jgi:ribose-phosphate pyrophosphokinase